MVRLRIFLRTHAAVIASGAKQSLFLTDCFVAFASRNDSLFSNLKTLCRLSIPVLAYLMASPALALAHGGMGPDEIGPPIVTSGLLGFASYWVVMLWPSRNKKNDQGAGSREQSSYTSPTVGRTPKHYTRVKRRPRLRKIEGNGQAPGDQNTRRKASDG